MGRPLFNLSRARNARPVVVAGGGIGGLACALGLALTGFRTLVLEQAQALAEIGAGLQLAPNAWWALDALGVGEPVKKEAVLIRQLLMMDGISGETVIEIPLGAAFAHRYGNPYAVTHRADLHGSLLEACRARPQLVELRTRCQVRGFALEDCGVTVELAGGERITGAALIGADGWHSAVREQILGDGAPPVSGHLCYRALLDVREMPQELRSPTATLWAGPNTHIVHYPLRRAKLFNLVATVVREQAASGHNEEALPDEVLPLFAHNCDKPMSLLRVPKAFHRWMLRFRQPAENWTQGPVTLLGDAAHLMLQYFAQGAAMAMEDAVCLAACAHESDGDFAAAFQRYQSMRLLRASRVQISAGLLGLVFHASGAARLVRNDIYRDRPPQRYYEALDWIFSAPDYVRSFRAASTL